MGKFFPLLLAPRTQKYQPFSSEVSFKGICNFSLKKNLDFQHKDKKNRRGNNFIMTRVGLTSFHVSGVNPDKPKHNSEMLTIITIISYGLFEFLVSRLAVGSYSSRYYH